MEINVKLLKKNKNLIFLSIPKLNMANLQTLINKNNEEDMKEKELIRTLNDLGDIQNSLNDLLLQQDQRLDTIEENLTLTEERVKHSLDDLAECDKLYFSYKPIVVGTLLGGAVFSPLVTLTGIKYLGISTGVGSLLGGLTGYKIQK